MSPSPTPKSVFESRFNTQSRVAKEKKFASGLYDVELANVSDASWASYESVVDYGFGGRIFNLDKWRSLKVLGKRGLLCREQGCHGLCLWRCRRHEQGCQGR